MVRQRPAYIVFYDGTCELCRRTRDMLTWMQADAPLMFVDASDRGQMAHWPQIDYNQAQSEVFVIDPRGRIHKGWGSVVKLMEATAPATRMFSPLLRLPGLYALGQAGYHLVSDRRHKISQALFGKK